jgi:hypothetical protein
MKTCPLCGRQNADENKFCNYCGTALSAEADPNKDPEVVEVKAEDKPEPEAPKAEETTPQESKPEENPTPTATPAHEGWSSADTFAIVSIACAAELIPVAGIVFGYLGLPSKRLHGLANAGFILSIIVTASWAIYITAYFVLAISNL